MHAILCYVLCAQSVYETNAQATCHPRLLLVYTFNSTTLLVFIRF